MSSRTIGTCYSFSLQQPCVQLPWHVLARVHRWAIYLLKFEFAIEHIDGKSSICTEMLKRWARGCWTNEARTHMVAALYHDIVPNSHQMHIPDMEEIKRVLNRAAPPKEITIDRNGICKKQNLIRIPEDAKDLKLQILMGGHCGDAGHRGRTVTLGKAQELFWWKDMRRDVDAFVVLSVHCIFWRAGEKIQRPLHTALHRQNSKVVVHVDLLFMGKSNTAALKYLPLFKDVLSGYCCLQACATADSDEATSALSKPIASFGGMNWLVSDQGPHFTASSMENLTSLAHIKHHLTMEYCSWANRTIERLWKEVLRVCHALLSEWRLSPLQWPLMVECIQWILNQSQVERLGQHNTGRGLSPLEVFAGLKPPTWFQDHRH